VRIRFQAAERAGILNGTGREPGERPGVHPHLVVARRLWSAIADADVQILDEILAPKTVWRMYGRSPLAGTFEGRDAVMRFMGRVGELSDELEASLIDIFVSERGAVMRYRISARRGSRRLDIEHLLLIEIEQGRIEEGVFAPVDQERYDRFWLDS
jgi:ketosteroid isomerase-like protein